MLLIGDPEDDPALAALSIGAWNAWARTVARCATTRSDIVHLNVLEASDEDVEEWERAELVQRLPFGNLRMLRRGSLWEI
jgi:hypothetical protein